MKRLLATALIGIGIGVAGTKGTDAIMESASMADSSYSLDLHVYIPVVPDSLCSVVETAHSDNIVHQYPLSTYVPNIYPNGDFDYSGTVNIQDLNRFVKWAFLGDTLPERPDF